MKIWIVPIALALACGGQVPTGCTLTVSGDAESGVRGFSVPCGNQQSFSPDTGYVLTRPYEYRSAGSGQARFDIDGQVADPATTGAGFTVWVGEAELPSTPITDQTLVCTPRVTASCTPILTIHFVYIESGKQWIASNDIADTGTAYGTFTFQLTSSEPVSDAECGLPKGTTPFPGATCLSVHGTGHGVMVPPVFSGNQARGTLTMDIAF